MNYKKILEQANFTPNEISVYQYLLDNGEQTGGTLIETTGIARGTTYYVLDRLEEFGLIERYKKGKKTYFSLKHPRALKQFLDSRIEDLQDAKETVGESYASLVDRFNLASNKPGIYHFYDEEGIKKIYWEVLADGVNTVYSLQGGKDLEDVMPKFIRSYVKERVKRGINNKSLAPTGNKYNTNSKKELREAREIPKKQFPYTMDIKIAGDKVIMVSYEKTHAIGVLMVDPAIAKNFMAIFNRLWETADQV